MPWMSPGKDHQMITTGPVMRITKQECIDKICARFGKDFRENDLHRPASLATVLEMLDALGLIQIEK